jgi:hypothetical protein
MQIQPVFPPREDVQVGDIHTYGYTLEETKKSLPEYDKIDGNKFMPIPIYIGSLDCRKALKDHYGARPIFAFTGDGPFWATGNGTTKGHLPEYRAQNGDLIIGPERPVSWNRLPAVQYPEFVNISFNTTDIGVVVPLEYFTAALGVSSQRYSKGSLKIMEAESIGLPGSKIFDLLEKAKLNDDSIFNDKVWIPNTIAYITNEVFYARKLTITFRADSATTGGLTIDIGNYLKLKGVDVANDPILKALKAQGGDIEQKRVSLDSLTPEQKAEYIEKVNSGFMGNSVAGANFKATSVGSQSISLDATFARPIAIGSRAIIYEKVNKE